MIRARFFARTALGLSLALGVAAGAVPALAKDKKPEQQEAKLAPSKAFIPIYKATADALAAADKRENVVAAKQKVTDAEAALAAAQGKKAKADANAALAAAIAELGVALKPEVDRVEATLAAATAPDDKYLSGALVYNIGRKTMDKALQRRGLQIQVDSGKLSPADTNRFNAGIGALAMDLKDYEGARVPLKAARDAGYTDGDVAILYADSFIKAGHPVEGLAALQEAIELAGANAPADWMRYGMAVAYKAKQPEAASKLATQLILKAPTTENWSLVIAVVRDLRGFAGQDQIDLLRLMNRTNSFAEERDYVDYIQAADPRRQPAEALKIINLGLAAGKLRATDQFVMDSKSQATSRIAEERATLPGYERDAKAPNATAAVAAAAADTFLGYGDAAKAEELYTIALTKPGIDKMRTLLRLGIAQADQGKWADAQASFGQVTDTRAPIAQLWNAYCANKAAGK